MDGKDFCKCRNRCRKTMAFLTVSLAAFGLSACGNGEKDEPLTAQHDPEAVLAAANEQYGKESVRGSRGTYIYTYADGSTEQEALDVSFDVENGIEQLIYTSGEEEEESGRTYNVKEDDTCYTYALDLETNAWIRYEQEPDENGETTYESQEKGVIYSYDEEAGYTDITYSNEGDETVEGKTAIKIKVGGYIGDTSEEEEVDAITRESILKDYEITEEAIGYIDGMSEALDRYVDAMNAAQNTEKVRFEACVWVEADTHRPLKNEMIIDTAAAGSQASSKDLSEFEDQIWKVYQLMTDMDEGMSVDEALKNIEELEPEMEQEIQAEKELLAEEDPEDDANDMAEEVYVTFTEERVYGDECTTIEELPEYYTEVTQDEYYNGEY